MGFQGGAQVRTEVRGAEYQGSAPSGVAQSPPSSPGTLPLPATSLLTLQ